MDKYSGEKFLDKLYASLYTSDEVSHTKDNNDKRYESIRKYLERLERVHNKANTESKKELLKSIYYDKYVIKEEILREKLKKIYYYYSDERINEEIRKITNSQKKSLSDWLDYLTDNSAHYPLWTKYWAFQGMLKMGNYDEGIEGYQKRSKDTEVPFVDANPEIIAKAISMIEKKVNKKDINDEELEKIVNTGSFSKIYTILEKRYKENVIEYSGIEGIWIKYNQGSKEDALNLCESLQNKNTHWCSADESYALMQLCGPYDSNDGGDFYVYYTKDKNDNYTLPRIAIRMIDHNRIGEIRGIEEGQNLEEEMTDILDKKLNEMSFLEETDKKDAFETIDGLKELTRIYKKTIQKEDLTDKELLFYKKKYGFGYLQDPRVEKTIKKRAENYSLINDFYKLKDYKAKALAYAMIKKNYETKELDEVNFIIEDSDFLYSYFSNSYYSFLREYYNYFDYDYNDKLIDLKYATPAIRKDRKLALKAIGFNYKLYEFIDDELKNDRSFILEAVKLKPYYILKHALDEFKKDKKIVLEAVKLTGYALEFADISLKKDREIVLTAVKHDGLALQFADVSLRNDKKIVLEALKQNSAAFKYADDSLKKDKDYILELAEIFKNKQWKLRDIFFYVDLSLKSDKKFILELLKIIDWALKYASDDLKQDDKFLNYCRYVNPNSIEHVEPGLKEIFFKQIERR